MIIKVMQRGSEEMRIHSVGNAAKGTQKYCFEVVTRTGRRVRGWDEDFPTFAEALRFAYNYGWR